MAAKAGSESKTGLVVSLVLFILLSIGLGVSTYYGFAGQKELETTVNNEKKKADDNWNLVEWYRYLALSERFYMGSQAINDPAIFDTLRGKFDTKTLVNKDDPDHETHQTLQQELEKKLGWDASQKRPTKTYDGEIARLTTELANTTTALHAKEAEADKLNRDLIAEKSAAKKAQDNYDAALAELRKTTETEKGKMLDDIKALQVHFDELNKKINEDNKELNSQKTQITAEKKKVEAEVKSLITTAETLKERLAKDQPKPLEQPKGKIRSLDKYGTMAYIDLGSADNLKTEVPFSIHGIGPDGKALRESKGSLEVLRILGDHLSQAHITEMQDAGRDPALPGDFLFNPAWNPNMKQHVAIAGIIDLEGDGRDHLEEFMRNLQRQNVVVDAYLDPKTNLPKGEITRQTDLLIEGITPDVPLDSKDTKSTDRKLKEATDVGAGLANMEKAADKFGVQHIKLKDFLIQSGYPLPRNLRTEKPAPIMRTPTVLSPR